MRKICPATLTIMFLLLLPAGNSYSGTDLPGIPLLLLKIRVPDGAVLSGGRQIWLARNLGASRIATSSTDAKAYGDLYQWGRLTDGHEKRDSIPGTGNVLSSTDVPGHAKFITTNNSPFDWRAGQNDKLWQGVNGINNPCPPGFRIPTDTEWQTEIASWKSNDAKGAFASHLKLVKGGSRYYNPFNPNISDEGISGHYWSSTVASSGARDLSFHDIDASMGGHARAYGYSVRCIMD